MQIPRVLSLVLLALLVAACGREAPLPQPTPAAPTAVVQTEPTASAPAEATATPAEGESADPLSGTHWQWVTLTDPAQQVQIEAPMDYTILFSEGDASIRADCNQAVGTYSVGPDQGLTITPGPTTLAACPEGSRSDEFLQKLGQVAIFSIQDDQLLLELPADGGTLVFARAGSATGVEELPSLVGTTWQWVGLSDPLQQVQIDNPSAYTITFVDDTNVAITADCNQASGTYSADGSGGMTITIGLTTMAACPPGSREQEFLQKLGDVAIYFFQDERLFLELPVDSGTLEFQPQ